MKKTLKYGFTVLVFSIPIVPLLDIVGFLFKSSSGSPIMGEVSKYFVMVIFTLLAIGLLQLIYRWKKVSSFASSISGHLTTIGILGTFVGIFVGLYSFDTSDLNKSVPLLLDGMKLAFSTSIAGLASSTVLTISHSIVISFSDDKEQDPFGPMGEDDGSTVYIPGFYELSKTLTILLISMAENSEQADSKLDKITALMEEQNDLLKKNRKVG